ncbi:MAG TPA: squalene/phytoene synthase family protein [Sphingomicrobium sp.]|nr:squalene/phytoene synthase family protein [Sphingomicrobium sp.]
MAEPSLCADRTLALSYVPARHRPALTALFAIDCAMGDVVKTTSEPALGAIRLAWWRERLEELDSGPPPAEPRLRSAAAELLPRGIAGRDVAALANGWLRLFEPFPWDVRVTEAIAFRGRHLFALGARLLAVPGEPIEAAGGLWALTDAARHCSDPQSRLMLLGEATAFARGLGGTKYPAGLRPLSMLAALAVRDLGREPFEAEGSPGRIAAMLAHRLSGKLPASS